MHDMTKQPQVSPRAVSVIEKSHPVPQAFRRSYAIAVALTGDSPNRLTKFSKVPKKTEGQQLGVSRVLVYRAVL